MYLKQLHEAVYEAVISLKWVKKETQGNDS